jgi:hypothetical protein
MKKSIIYGFALLFTSIFSPISFGQFGEQNDDGRPGFMRGWSERQIQEYYQQQKMNEKSNQEQMKGMIQDQRRNQNAKTVFGRMNSEMNKKLVKAKALRAKAAANKRMGFGKIQLNIQGPDLSKKRFINLSMGMDLGTKDHRFGCYSKEQSELAFVAKRNVSGYMQEITIKLKNMEGTKFSKNEILEISAKKSGRIDFKLEVPSKYFKRYGNRNIGEIKILSYKKGTKQVNSGGWIRYHGCAKDQGPQEGGASGGSGGGRDDGGYGNY